MVILAAGRATRFGATKQLAVRDGRPLIAHVVRAAVRADVGRVLVVVGHDADAVASAARAAGPVSIVVNPDHADGQATSLRVGLDEAAAAQVEAVVVLLADEPDVSADAIAAVAAATAAERPVVRARYDDGEGHPIGLHRTVLTDAVIDGQDRGARHLLASATTVPVAGPRPQDVDTPADLRG